MGLVFLLTQAREYSRVGFAPHDGAFGTIFYCLTGLHGAHVFVGLSILALHDDPRLPGPLLAGAPPRRRDRRDLLALRGRNVDCRVLDRLPHLTSMINPLRSEAEAFRFLIASIVYFGAIVDRRRRGRKVGRALGVFIALTAAVVVGWWLHARRDERPDADGAAPARRRRTPHPRDRERDRRRPHVCAP